MLVALLVMKGATSLLHIPDPGGATPAVGGQFLFYLLIFLALRVMFQVQYGRPFWQSLGWKKMGLPVLTIAMLGVATALAVAMAGAVLRTPDTPNQITEMMRDPMALILLAVFGIAVAPVARLAFRGFLQPLMVRSLGAVPGILARGPPSACCIIASTETPGAMPWCSRWPARSGLRHNTGSTKASASCMPRTMLSSFVVFPHRKDLPHLWWKQFNGPPRA